MSVSQSDVTIACVSSRLLVMLPSCVVYCWGFLGGRQLSSTLSFVSKKELGWGIPVGNSVGAPFPFAETTSGPKLFQAQESLRLYCIPTIRGTERGCI